MYLFKLNFLSNEISFKSSTWLLLLKVQKVEEIDRGLDKKGSNSSFIKLENCMEQKAANLLWYEIRLVMHIHKLNKA